MALLIFVTSNRFCQAVCPILPGSPTNFEIGLGPILCNVICLSVKCIQKLNRRPGKIDQTAKIRLILAVSCKRPFSEEVNCTEPSPLVSIPWTNTLAYFASEKMGLQTSTTGYLRPSLVSDQNRKRKVEFPASRSRKCD